MSPMTAVPYAILDGNNVIQNTCLWDGIAPWLPPAGMTAVPLAQALANGAIYRAAPPPTTFAPLDFINLFTTAEQQAIVAALPASPALFVWYSKLMAANEVDLANPDTIAGVNALAGAGLLTTQRAAAILSGSGPSVIG
jgi:hypothetical protein